MMKLTLGNRVSMDVRTGKEPMPDGREMLALSLTINTPFGPIENSTYVTSETLRTLLVWLRTNYGMIAYDFVSARTPLHATLPRKMPWSRT